MPEAAALRLREPTHPIKDGRPMAQLLTTARNEVEALGHLTAETALALTRNGVDVAMLERRLLDA